MVATDARLPTYVGLWVLAANFLELLNVSSVQLLDPTVPHHHDRDSEDPSEFSPVGFTLLCVFSGEPLLRAGGLT